jgi:pimeloyl-ACP methyl ester carboxylesterase/DNA-binding winged helix-turn-helix (wHTH) protein
MIYRFADCELDVARHRLLVAGEARHVEPQVFDLLRLLVERPGALVSRDALVEAVWGGRIVSESAIDARVNAARRAVGDDGRSQRVIETVPRRGIRLACQVSAAEDAPAAPPPPMLEQRVRYTRSADGSTIAYATTGSGPPLLRAGHWLTHLELDWLSPVWRPLLEALGADFALTRWDQRGTGLSGREIPSFALDSLADDLAAVADAAGLDRFPLFAASQGVPVGIEFAARHPGRLSALVLYGGYAVGRRHRDEAAVAESVAFTTLIASGWGRPTSPFVTAFVTLFMPDATREQIEDFARMQLASASAETAVRLRRAIDGFDVRERLAAVDVPTLVIHSREDAVQPLDQARMIAAGIPGAELLVLESRNHIPLPQDPAWSALVAAIRAFCR